MENTKIKQTCNLRKNMGSWDDRWAKAEKESLPKEE